MEEAETEVVDGDDDLFGGTASATSFLARSEPTHSLGAPREGELVSSTGALVALVLALDSEAKGVVLALSTGSVESELTALLLLASGRSALELLLRGRSVAVAGSVAFTACRFPQTLCAGDGERCMICRREGP